MSKPDNNFTQQVLARLEFWLKDLFDKHPEYWNVKPNTKEYALLEGLLNMFVSGYFYGAHEFTNKISEKEFIESVKKSIKIEIDFVNKSIKLKIS